MSYLIGIGVIIFAYAVAYMLFLRKNSTINKIVFPLTGILAFMLAFSGSMFYAEPGYIYHVRTIAGTEKVVSDVGYNFHWFGRYNSWKRAMTVQATNIGNSNVDDTLAGERTDSTVVSAQLSPQKIVFLDQVDARIQSSVRFKIPSDEEMFLNMVHEYRTPDNLLRATLVPAFRETLQATASLMTAEEYYSGGRTEFSNEFENQMNDGIYIVKRIEKIEKTAVSSSASANASKGQQQDEYGDDEKVVYVVEKQYDENGQMKKNTQNFLAFGISVVEARITDIDPNARFQSRMEQKQEASAKRAIAREERVQEEEQELLANAKGKRQVAERQAQAKVEQIERTTKAETEKQLALTKALKIKEQAEIEKEAAAIQLERDKLIAESQKVLADAEAYKRTAIIESDNALQQKLDAEIEIQKVWAEAFAERPVPQTMFITGGGAEADGVQVGSNTELQNMMNIMTMQMAKSLDNDRSLNNQ